MAVRLADEQARALVQGMAMPLDEARLALTDDGVARGDGAFETAGVWGGRAFRLADHLARLDASLSALALPPAPRAVLEAEVAQLLEGVTADAALRMYLTGSGTRVLTLAPLPDRGDLVSLEPQPAPWIQPVGSSVSSGAKSMSYSPNMTASRRARAAGADDALLVSVPDGWVLEGPTFGVVVLREGRLLVPAVDLGIVDSISRRTLLEVAASAGIEVEEGRWPLSVLEGAQAVVVSSSLRPAAAVRRVGAVELPWPPPPEVALLADGLEARRRA